MKLKVRAEKTETALTMFEGIEVDLEEANKLREAYKEDPTILLGEYRSDAMQKVLDAVERGDATWLVVFISEATDNMIKGLQADAMMQQLMGLDFTSEEEEEDEDEFTRLAKEALR